MKSRRERIRRAGFLAMVGGSVALVVACAGGVSQADYDAVKQQVAVQEQTVAAQKQAVAAQEQTVANLQREVQAFQQQLAEKSSKEETQKLLNEVNNNVGIWRLQPGTAPRMMEIAHYFNNMWFAAQAGNWTYAEFEVYRTDETVKAIKTVRPARAEGLDAWMSQTVEPLRKTVEAKDRAGFVASYDRAVQGCNECHASSEGGGISLMGVKVTRPTAPVLSNLDYRGN